MSRELNQLYDKLRVGGSYAMSGKDIDNIIKPKIFILDLVKNKRVNQLLPKKKDNCVIFVPNHNSNIGHWVGFLRDGDKYEYLDSYGLKPAKVPLFDIAGLIVNKYRYQKMNDDITTCGFHVVWRLFCFMIMGMNNADYYKFMKTPKDHDRAVVFLVNMITGHGFDL